MSLTPRRLAVAVTLLSAALSAPRVVVAQVRASEPATISQTVDGTVISLAYSRPRLRGRSGVFGSRAVHWGETWTPGANWATTLELNHDVTIEGRAVPKGKYSLWMVLRQSGDWTLLLDPKAKRFHMDRPDTATVPLRVPVHPQHGPATEVLTWSFPDIQSSGTTLAMQWDTVRVALDIRVPPSLRTTTPEADARPLVGTYDVTTRDSSSRTRQFVVTYESGTLRGDFVPQHPFFNRFALIRVAPDTYVMGLYDKGEIVDVLRNEMTFGFAHAAGRPATVEMRTEQDALYWAGTRRP